MERLTEALDAFFRFQLQSNGWVAYAIFVAAAGIAGLAIVILDYCSVALGRETVLELTHGRTATPKAAIVWVIDSVLAAALGLLSRFRRLDQRGGFLIRCVGRVGWVRHGQQVSG